MPLLLLMDHQAPGHKKADRAPGNCADIRQQGCTKHGATNQGYKRKNVDQQSTGANCTFGDGNTDLFTDHRTTRVKHPPGARSTAEHPPDADASAATLLVAAATATLFGPDNCIVAINGSDDSLGFAHCDVWQ